MSDISKKDWVDRQRVKHAKISQRREALEFILEECDRKIDLSASEPPFVAMIRSIAKWGLFTDQTKKDK